MRGIVPRTCTEIPARYSDQNISTDSRPLEDFRSVPAYVLLGDPGSGKTTAFEAESTVLGNRSCLITARDFLTLAPNSHPAWRHKTLFIDGLDEIRSGALDKRRPFDHIRRCLDNLGRPRFRISCRNADWLGTNDRKHLESISPDSQVRVLCLDPLTQSAIVKVVDDYLGKASSLEFIQTARQRGVAGLLDNPQSLRMLTQVVSHNEGWPRSRLETFERACLQLVSEHNEEHRLGKPLSSPHDLLEASGRLCAIQLISGASGFTFNSDRSNQDYLSIDMLDRRNILRYALSTKCFKSASEDYLIPVHRHIAEYLAARYLAQLVEEGLPARRAISLITGGDGYVVTEMRGLSAWIASHSHTARTHLITLDPIGICLYGDIRGFSLDDRYTLLNVLRREGIQLSPLWRNAAAFSTLVTPDTEPLLRKVITDDHRDENHQMFTDFVLRILRNAVCSLDLSRILTEILYDESRWPRVKYAALDVLIGCRSIQDKKMILTALLTDIQGGELSDPDNELLGTLLTQLYPNDLPPALVWEYLSEEGNPELIGRHLVFWDRELIRKSSDEQVADLLDHLWPKLSALRPALDCRHLNGLPLRLLARGLRAHGDKIETGRLYDWLSVGSSRALGPTAYWYGGESIRKIRAWLDRHADVQKAIILEGLERCPRSDDVSLHAINVEERLYGCIRPPDFGLWCLNQAIIRADNNPQIAEHLAGLAYRGQKYQVGNDGLSIGVLDQITEKHEFLNSTWQSLVAPTSIPQESRHEISNRREHIEARGSNDMQRINLIRSHEVALRQNRAPAALLSLLARQYFGSTFSGGGPKAIEKWIRGDQDLMDAVLYAFRGLISRTDVPEIEEILSLHRQNKRHSFALPFLASLAELERTGTEYSSGWEENQRSKALAFYYCTPHGNYEPNWYRRLLETCPETVANVQVQFADCEFRRGSEHIYNLWHLAHHSGHSQVARYASLPLLRLFPVRCKLRQIRTLDQLLWSALQHANRSGFLEIIGKKLAQKRMNIAQRVRWLAVGVLASPTQYRDHLYAFVHDSRHRSRNLAVFLCPEDRVRFSFDELRSPILRLLITLVACYVGPDQESEASGWVTAAMRSSYLVRNLIQHLAERPSEAASDALEALLSDTTLAKWHNVLSRAQNAQRSIRRDASYVHPDILQICRTFDGLDPANAADLAALVTDKLCELAEQIRQGNTDDWHQYWNEDRYGRATRPKHENSCRDVLLSHLRERLPRVVEAQPEGQYANDKRADIRISCRGFEVPVEVKKSQHRDLWKACRRQLIEQYTSEPSTGGYGIYLVLWFGKDRTQQPPSGRRPGRPEELKDQLMTNLSNRESRKISVCVIDVSQVSQGVANE